MSEPSPSDGTNEQAGEPAPKRRLFPKSLSYIAIAGGLIFIFLVICSGPIYIGPKYIPSFKSMQTSRTIALAMFQYANDYGQNYPDGKSSTEVFQKLLDGSYVADPSIFYIPMPGKTKPVAGQPLKPENVCFDVTSPVDASSPDGLPIVFSTGYKVNYVPGGTAVPLVKPYPIYVEPDPRTWLEKWHNQPELDTRPGIAVCYKSNSAQFQLFQPATTENPDGSIPNFVPPDFNAQGKTYRQLTPDGILLDK